MRGHFVGIGVICVMLWGFSVVYAQWGRISGLVLLTPQEAEVLRLTEEEWTASAGVKTRSLGPLIVFQSPLPRETSRGPLLETSTPMDLTVVFERRGAAVDMQSLRVQARKGLFTKSFTEMLRPYVQGMRIEAKGVQVPVGRFGIQIEIADVQGVKTSETYRLEVKEQGQSGMSSTER